MKYMLLVYPDEAAFTEESRQACYVVQTPDRETAIRIAARIPAAHVGTIEFWPIV